MINYLWLQQYYFFGLAQVIGVILLTLYFIFGVQSTQMELIDLIISYIPLLVFQQLFFLWSQRFNVDPKKEKGFMLSGKLLNWAAWPIYFIAFIGVLTNKRLTYKVTPKGDKQKERPEISLFMPHFILGTATLIDIIISIHTKHQVPQLLFWAVLNTFVMYFFVFQEMIKYLFILQEKLKGFFKEITPHSLPFGFK
jgi:hypothetical protein